MANMVKRIGILTSGGDAPGMNAAVRAVVRTAVGEGIECIGIRRGWTGLISSDFVRLDGPSVSHIINRGGTILYTARSEEFMDRAGREKAIATCRLLGLDAIVAIGGDGTFRGALALSRQIAETNQSLSVVGIPATIDNDIGCSHYTIGFDTAMNTAMEAVDRLRDTSQSHDRCSVVEVMGRRAGWLALRCGIAVGATSILVPEAPFDLQKDVIDRMVENQRAGKQHFVVVVAEGVGNVSEIAKEIQTRTGIESRATVLGHIQRGGSPTVTDRVVASQMGYHAVELLSKGIGNRVVAMKADKVVDYNISEALQMKKPFDFNLYQIAHDISI